MPYPNEHSARLQDPKKFSKKKEGVWSRTKGGTIYGNKKVPASIGIIWGKLKDKDKSSDFPIPQALRFSIKTWTSDEAKEWLKKNNISYIKFEKATKKKADLSKEETEKEYTEEEILQEISKEMEEETEEDLGIKKINLPYTVKDKVLLKEGKWNDVFYPAEELKKKVDELNNAKELLATTGNEAEKRRLRNMTSLFWDHDDAAKNWLGDVTNFSWDNGERAIKGDLNFVDEDAAKKIAYQDERGYSSWGISPRIVVDRIGDVASRLRFVSFAVVHEPAQGEEAMLSKEASESETESEKTVIYDEQKDVRKEEVQTMSEETKKEEEKKEEEEKKTSEDTSKSEDEEKKGDEEKKEEAKGEEEAKGDEEKKETEEKMSKKSENKDLLEKLAKLEKAIENLENVDRTPYLNYPRFKFPRKDMSLSDEKIQALEILRTIHGVITSVIESDESKLSLERIAGAIGETFERCNSFLNPEWATEEKHSKKEEGEDKKLNLDASSIEKVITDTVKALLPHMSTTERPKRAKGSSKGETHDLSKVKEEIDSMNPKDKLGLVLRRKFQSN